MLSSPLLRCLIVEGAMIQTFHSSSVTTEHSDERSGAARCPLCRLHRARCLCAALPRIETQTRLVLVLHRLEARKTTNTGHLALRCLTNSSLLVRGERERPLGAAAPGWREHGEPVLLFPHADAQPLEALRDRARGPLTLIVPDGTWRQARRVRNRVPGLADVPCATIQAAAPSNYRLRSTPHAGRLATLEAIAEALGILEGPAPRESLLVVFRLMVERSLGANGRLRYPSRDGESGTDRG
jgi:DTW domain-containing protein